MRVFRCARGLWALLLGDEVGTRWEKGFSDRVFPFIEIMSVFTLRLT